MEVEEAIRLRRSVRSYLPQEVREEDLNKVLEAAILAPSAGNAQNWAFVVVRDPEQRRRIAELIQNAHFIYFRDIRQDEADEESLRQRASNIFKTYYDVPVFIFVCRELRRQIIKPEEYAEMQRLWDLESASAAIENMLLMARSLGLATCWTAVIALVEKELRELLQIPEEVEIVAVTPLGYTSQFPEKRPRLPLEQVVHYETW